MRIYSLKMVGFKKYLDSTIEFGPGLNVFYGPNEAGKSTLHQALVTGLYGIGRKGEDNLVRSKEDARSWQATDECSVELDYGIEGRRFVIRRDILAGKAELYRVEPDGTRVLETANRDDIAGIVKQQTGIENPFVFSRTISVSQADLTQVSELGRIGNNIEASFGGSAAISASAAIEFLDKKVRKRLRRIGNESPGRLDQLGERLESLLSEIDKARTSEKRREELSERIASLETRLPLKSARHKELGDLIAKSEARSRIEQKLEEDRRRFNALEDRIHSIEECARKLDELAAGFQDLGPITLFDPDQLDAARADLDRARADLDARALACADRIQAMQRRLKSAEELAGEITLIEQHIGELGKLSSDDPEKIDARRREMAEKLKACEEQVKQQTDRLEHIEHSLWGLEQFARKYPNLGDAWQMQSEWQRLQLRKDECRRALERVRGDLAQHEAHKHPPTFGSIFIELPLPLGIVGLGVLAALLENLLIEIPLALACAACATWWIMWKTKRRNRREQWRADRQRLQEVVDAAEAVFREISDVVTAFAGKIGVAEEKIDGFIEEYRLNQIDLRSLRREQEQYAKERDLALAAKAQAEKESRQLTESFGCANLSELRDRIAKLRELRRGADGLSERLAGVLGLDKVSAREEMLFSARGILAELGDQRKKIEAEQMELARRESELLHRTSCDDIVLLAERTRRLRALIGSRDRITASLEAHGRGKTLDELKSEQHSITLEIKVAMARLEQDFPGFEPLVEQTEFWRNERDQLEFEIPELTGKLSEARTALAVLEGTAVTSPAELLGEKEYVEAEIEQGDFVVTACSIAVDVLREVERDLHNVYLPQIEKEASEYFSRMTAGNYAGLSLVETWPQHVAAVDQGGRHIDPERLSRGTLDQLYFSLRLALGNALSGRTLLPLILDDPFVNFDDARFAEAVDSIIQLAQAGRQVIYFTHSQQLGEMQEQWKEQGIDVNCVALGE